MVHFSHSAQLPRSNQSPPHSSPAAQPKPPAQTSSTQPGPLPLSRGPVSPARSHGFPFPLGLSFPLRPSVRPPLHSACSAPRDAPSPRGPLNRSAQRVALPAPLQPGPTRQLHPLAALPVPHVRFVSPAAQRPRLNPAEIAGIPFLAPTPRSPARLL